MHHLLSVSLIIVGCALTPLVPANPVTVRDEGLWFNSSTPMSVEVVVVVDKAAYDKWYSLQNGSSGQEKHQQSVTAITSFVTATFRGANLIWQGMQTYGAYIDLRIAQLRIVSDEVVVQPNADGRTVLNENAFWGFFRWLIRNGFEFDHALLLTGFDVVSTDNSPHEGYAYMDTMCSTESISVVESIINGIPAVVLAHEVGHSFGARHDGNRNDCNSTSGYIMNANNIGHSPRHWNYSTCSAAKIVQKLRYLTDFHDCLSQYSTWSPRIEEGPFLGHLYTADQICQMSVGDHSYVCRHLYRPDSKSICSILWCLVNSTYCTGVAPVDGLPCGTGKRCLAGDCVPFDDVPDYVTDTCYTGDKPPPAWRDQSCSQVVNSYTHMCHDQWYRDFCCQSCQNVSTGNEDCPYGDAHERCAPFYCGTRWEHECCETCVG